MYPHDNDQNTIITKNKLLLHFLIDKKYYH